MAEEAVAFLASSCLDPGHTKVCNVIARRVDADFLCPLEQALWGHSPPGTLSRRARGWPCLQ